MALSIGYLLVSTDLGRGLVVPRVLRLADDALAGSIQLRSFHLLGQGGLELVGARVLDPDGEVVLEIRAPGSTSTSAASAPRSSG